MGTFGARLVGASMIGIAAVLLASTQSAMAQASSAPTGTSNAPTDVVDAASDPSLPQPGTVTGETPQAQRSEDDITVVGTRLGAGDASDVKRRALQSISVLTAADIEKLPDTSLGSVLRKVPGVQVSTRTGGATIRIRGLGQTEDRVNGHNLTSTVGRGYDVAALPSDIVSGVDVYKTPSASLIEGGIGGQIDFHTRRPFDFNGFAGAASAEASYGTVTKAVQPLLSAYVSDRFETGIGQIGVLLGGAYQRNVLGNQVFSIGSYRSLDEEDATSPVVPNDATKEQFHGGQELLSAYASAQWRPDTDFTLTGDFIYNRSSLSFSDRTLTANFNEAEPTATSGDGRNTQRATYAEVPLTSNTNFDDAYFETFQGSLSGQYVHDSLTLFGGATYTHTSYHDINTNIGIKAVAPSITVDSASRRPDFTVTGIDPTVADTWAYQGFGNYAGRDASTEWEYRADAIYAVNDVLTAIKVGGRYDRRTVESIYGDGPPEGYPLPDDLGTPVAPYAGITPRRFYGSQSRWYSPSAFQQKQYVDSTRQFFGQPAGAPPFEADTRYQALEKVYNAYAELTFSIPVAGITIDGNAGVRYAKTKLSIDSFTFVDDGAAEPVTDGQNYQNWLPQINVRAKLTDELLLRLAFSKQVTRPGFFSFNPGLSLDTQNRTGSSGNPRLKPLLATQYDVSLEYYFADGGSLYAAGFYKDVSGFVLTERRPETIRGVIYQISRPYNLQSGYIGGAEVGYQQRFTFLPGILSAFGINANYTFVTSSRPENSSGIRAPLPGLARHNYQLTGDFQRDGLYASVSWVWNSRIVLAASADDAGRPLFAKPYGQLDASVSYDITKRISLTASALNLLQREDIQYLQDRALLNYSGREDRRFILGARIKFGEAR